MIYGIGTDIVQVDRMQKNLTRFGDKFAARLLAQSEYDEFQESPQPAGFLAKRFAAKEATAKAMGTGFTDGLSFKDIGITHDERGKPLLVLMGRAQEFIQTQGICESHVSLADEKDYAVAFVMLIK